MKLKFTSLALGVAFVISGSAHAQMLNSNSALNAVTSGATGAIDQQVETINDKTQKVNDAASDVQKTADQVKDTAEAVDDAVDAVKAIGN